MRLLKNIGQRSLLAMLVFVVATQVQAAPKPKALVFWDDHEPSSGLKPDHSTWQTLLEKYVIIDEQSGINRFDYDGMSIADELSLRAYLEYLQKLDPRQLNKDSQKAYWINLYNSTVALIVVVEKPDSTIRSVNSREVWTRNRFKITMQDLSLDNIEHGILRPLFGDERIHFALHKASLGSANIGSEAYTADNVESLIEKSTQEFFSHSRAVQVRGSTLVLSRIFKWYEDDFGGSATKVKNYIKSRVSVEMATKVEASKGIKYQYDWSINRP